MGKLREVIFGGLAASAWVMSPAVAQAQDNVQLYRIPKNYLLNGVTYPNLEGHVINIANVDNLVLKNPPLLSEKVLCARIHPDTESLAGQNKRTACTNGTTYTCKQLYSDTIHNSGVADLDRMVPNMPIHYWVNEAKGANTAKDYIGLNLGFFNTRQLPGRDPSDTAWKPIYQETCGRTLGPLKREGANALSQWYSRAFHVEKKADGTSDQYFGALRITPGSPSGGIGADQLATTTPSAYDADLVFSGVFIRWNQANLAQTHQNIPDFVEEKWDSVVGRTAVGFNYQTKKVRFVVIQNGRDGIGQGASVDTIRNLVGSATEYPYVMLLDGSGSSQLATSKTALTATGAQYIARRADCLFRTQYVKDCSDWGDLVGPKFVSHWGSTYYKANGTTGNVFVDRPVPSFIVFEDN